MRRRRNLITTLVLAAAVALLAVAGVAAADEPGASPAAVAAPASSPVATPAATPALTLTAAPEAVTAGDAATLTVRLADVPGATLQLSRKVAGAAGFRVLGPLVTSARGVAFYRVLPSTTTTYRVDYAGDGAQWLPASAEVTVSVRPRVTVVRHGARVPRRPRRPRRDRPSGASGRDGLARAVEGRRVGRVAQPAARRRLPRAPLVASRPRRHLAAARRHAGRRRASGGALRRPQA